MSTFTPTSRTTYPPPDGDAAGQAILKSLGRPIGHGQSWSVLKSLILGVLTFGVVPILSWIRGFRTFTNTEQQQLLHLAKWLRANTSHPLAKRLEDDANELRPRWWLWMVAILALLGTFASIFGVIHRANWPPGEAQWHALLAGTYGFKRWHIGDYVVWPFPYARQIFMIWIWGLSAVYALHWLQVQLHAADVKRFVRRFSEIAESEGLHKVRAASLGVPIAPLWLAAGVLMLKVFLAPWGLAAMLAGGAQRRYIHWTSRDTRADLAHRVRAMLIRRGASAVVVHGAASSSVDAPAAPAAPVPVYLRQRCVHAMCRAELPKGANYCRRCGTRQKPQVDRVV